MKISLVHQCCYWSDLSAFVSIAGKAELDGFYQEKMQIAWIRILFAKKYGILLNGVCIYHIWGFDIMTEEQNKSWSITILLMWK